MSTAIVWADGASPFTGSQVKELLDENERLRKENASLLGGLNVKERDRRQHRDALQAWADRFAAERPTNPTKREADLWDAVTLGLQLRVPLVPLEAHVAAAVHLTAEEMEIGRAWLAGEITLAETMPLVEAVLGRIPGRRITVGSSCSAEPVQSLGALLRGRAKDRRRDADDDRLVGRALDRALYMADGLEEAASIVESQPVLAHAGTYEVLLVPDDDGPTQTLRVLRNGVLEQEERDGGEPEDQLFYRDWKWVPEALRSAYESGLEDGRVPRTETAVPASIPRCFGCGCLLPMHVVLCTPCMRSETVPEKGEPQ